MQINTLADFKRYLATPEAKIKLVSAPTMPNHKYLGVTRGVAKLQTNAVKLEGGSWLDWYRGTKGFTFRGSEIDVLDDNGSVLLTYQIL